MPKKDNAIAHDFDGMATQYGVKCDDGRTILPGAFAHQDGARVPFVWRHQHKSVDNVLGHAILESRKDGMYAYVTLNETTAGKNAKIIVHSGDVNGLSIYANKLQERNGQVRRGEIREVSLVLYGANPGAGIHNIVHEIDGLEEPDWTKAVIFMDSEVPLNIVQHEAPPEQSEETVGSVLATFTDDQTAALAAAVDFAMTGEILVPEDGEGDQSGPDFKTVYGSLNETQKRVFDYLVAESANDDVTHSGDSPEDNEEDEGVMKKNLFNKESMDDQALIHEGLEKILEDGPALRSLRESYLKHAGTYGIDNIEYLFPDGYIDPDGSSQIQTIQRDQAWVAEWMSQTRHTPYSRIKTRIADLTPEAVRARGYVTGNLKVEQVIALLKRTTDPTTVYVKQKFDRDDLLDITEFSTVVWTKQEMNMMLREEVARAGLIGDGRLISSDDKIDETKIRPIYSDDAVYVVRKSFAPGTGIRTIIDGITESLSDYKGSGSPTLWCTTEFLNDMYLDRDADGHRMYRSIQELVATLRIKGIVDVEPMAGIIRDDGGTNKELLGILVNPRDYTYGADKGGSTQFFSDFDIDYNQEKFLLEGRTSGALTKPAAAIVFELELAP